MKKILVTTDLSQDSKSGIRFALQLSTQSQAQLIFLYVMEPVLKPVRWSAETFEKYRNNQFTNAEEQLQQFVGSVLEQASRRIPNVVCTVVEGGRFSEAVIEHAKKVKADFICMSTRGAGTLRKVIGTNASDMLTTSPVPVLVVPKSYKRSPVKKLVYATDMENLPSEVKRVKAFSEPLKAKVTAMHYDYMVEFEETRKKLVRVADKYTDKAFSFSFQNLSIDKPLAEKLNKDVVKEGADLVVMFTKQDRNWFDRLFLSSKTAELAFNTKVPMLVFRKKES